MLFGVNDLFWLGVLPCVTAAAAMYLCGRVGVRCTAAWSASVAGGLVVGIAGQNVRVGWATAWEKLAHPVVALDWLPWLVLLAAAINAMAAYAPRSWQRWLVTLAGVVAIVVPLRLLASNVAAMNRWGVGEKLAVLSLWSALFAGAWLTLAVGRLNRQPILRGGLLAVVAMGIAVTVAASGSITLGELGVVAAAALVGVLAAAWLTKQLADGPSGASGPLAVMLVGLLLLGHFHAELSAANAALLAVSLAAAAGYLPLPLGEGRGEGPSHIDWGLGVLRIAVTLVPLAVAVISAVARATADPYG